MEPNHQPIRVLHIVGRMDRGGIETMLMNLYRNIDRSRVQFDFLAHYGREAAYNEEIRALGGRIYEMPALRDEEHVYYWRLFSYIKALNDFFREHREYRVIHGHMTNTASIYMPIAKKHGVARTIAHSHSTKGKAGLLGILTNFLQRPIHKHATDWFACSQAAAHWFYPAEEVKKGRVTIIPNAIDAGKFRFSQTTRQEVRRELQLEDRLVIGSVGRFRPEKNQTFLLDVLAQAKKIDLRAFLLFVGEGPCEEAVKEKCRGMGLEDSVAFLGQRSDVPRLMQAMDAFAMPSLWEGLPLVGMEAQAAGLRCVVSDTVTQEMDTGGMVEYLPLDAPLSRWAEALLASAGAPRTDTFDALVASGYDIHTTAPWLQAFYLSKHNSQQEPRI